MPRTVHAVCSHDCPDSCGVLVTIDETGRATKLRGDPSHPVTRGFLCGKVAKYLDRVYSPDRLLYPMRRRAGVPKASLPHGREAESFERISWDEALDTIAARLAAIAREHGPESILPYSYAGTIGVLNYGSMDRRFFHRLGASQLDRTICSETGGQALISVYGRKLGTDPEAFPHAKLIIAWAANIHGNNIHLWPFVEEARRNGAKLVVIDPYATRTARAADWHIPINPGTDSALALGLMHIIVRDRPLRSGLRRPLDLRLRSAPRAHRRISSGLRLRAHRHLRRRHRAPRPRLRHHRSCRHPPQLRRAAQRQRRRSHARHRHAARAHRRMETLRRRTPAFHQRRLSLGQSQPSSAPTSCRPAPSAAKPASSTCRSSATR